jgi:hypothetical protein
MISKQLDKKIFKITRRMAYMTDCGNGLHSYYKSPHTKDGSLLCSSCQNQTVSWNTIKKRDANQIHFVSTELRKEWWRNYWWDIEIADVDLEKAKKITNEKLSENVKKRIASSVGRVYLFKGKVQPFNDGYQTPYTGNIIFYAQHAMATCCRYCIEYWHGIPQGRKLDETEVEYLSEVTLFYISLKLSNE